MQKHAFEFMGRRVELWTHPEPDHIGRVIHHGRCFYEADVLMKCREVHLPGTAIVDVGANIGNHSVFFGAILGAPVFAFEPFAGNFELLEMNVAANRLNGRVIASRVAVGAREGLATMHPGPADNLGVTRASFGSGDVPVTTLDAMALPGPIGLVKIDVEGAEADVLAGGEALLRRWLPDIMIEAGQAEAFRSIAGMLLPLGYAPAGRYAATPTYLFRAVDQAARLRSVLG